MKSVLISIRPKWCDKIATGEKTVEVRKNRPKLDVPFKCYIYRTRGIVKHIINGKWVNMAVGGTVIGEFVCDGIFPISVMYSDQNSRVALREFPYTCLTDKEIMDYLGNGKTGYGWHISDLVIYDEPLELRQFVTEGDCDCSNCGRCYWFDGGNGYNVEADCNLVYEYLGTGKTLKPLFRPPQSWCYVEEG